MFTNSRLSWLTGGNKATSQQEAHINYGYLCYINVYYSSDIFQTTQQKDNMCMLPQSVAKI